MSARQFLVEPAAQILVVLAVAFVGVQFGNLAVSVIIGAAEAIKAGGVWFIGVKNLVGLKGVAGGAVAPVAPVAPEFHAQEARNVVQSARGETCDTRVAPVRRRAHATVTTHVRHRQRQQAF